MRPFVEGETNSLGNVAVCKVPCLGRICPTVTKVQLNM